MTNAILMASGLGTRMRPLTDTTPNYLKEKYSNLEIIENLDYKTVNNISSIYYAKEKLLLNDCFICEADLYISDLQIFKNTPKYSCYFGKMIAGYSDDWVFDVGNGGFITRVGKIGSNQYNMVGLSYFTKSDAKILAKAIENAYRENGFENLFYPVSENQIVEIDTVEELNNVIKNIK